MAICINPKVDRQHFLENSNFGFDFYEFVLGELQKVDEDRCENVCSTFYNDTKPGLSVYFKNDQWYYHDYGETTYSGDVFSFASCYYELDLKIAFGKILRRMYEDLDIEILQEEIFVPDSIYD